MWYVMLLWREDGQLRPAMRTSRQDTLADVIDAAMRWLRLSGRSDVPSNLKYSRWTVTAAQAAKTAPESATGDINDCTERWD